jgi:hypothetical protein
MPVKAYGIVDWRRHFAPHPFIPCPEDLKKQLRPEFRETPISHFVDNQQFEPVKPAVEIAKTPPLMAID